jgi:hypothetical protein
VDNISGYPQAYYNLVYFCSYKSFVMFRFLLSGTIKLLSVVIILCLHLTEVESLAFGDLTVFGPCVIHIKQFSDKITSIDLTSRIISSTSVNGGYNFFSIFNGTHLYPQIQPVAGIREKCTVNVIIDFNAIHYQRLVLFMDANRYTFNSKPLSVYVLVVRTSYIAIYPSTVTFPTSIFVLKAPHNLMDTTAMESNKLFLFFCMFCAKHIQSISSSTDIRILNDTHYQSKWLFPQQYIQALMTIYTSTTRDISNGETLIWQRWLASYIDRQDPVLRGCRRSHAFFDLLARRVQGNLAVYLETDLFALRDGYTGHIAEAVYSNDTFMHPSFGSNAYFHLFASGTIFYCNCDRLSERSSINKWVNCLPTNLWGFLIGLVMLMLCLNIGQDIFRTGTLCVKDVCILFVDLIAIILRQGDNRSTIIIVFCLTVFVISNVYENGLTSEIIVPEEKSIFDLKQLISSGYRILYPGGKQSDNRFASQLEDVSEIMNQSKTHIASENLQAYSDKHEESLDFVYNEKVAMYAVRPPRAQQQVHKSVRSVAPSFCMCTNVRDLHQNRPMLLAFNHRLRWRFSYYMDLLIQSGINQLFDNQLELITYDYGLNMDDEYSSISDQDTFISLKNLYPLLYIIGSLIGFSSFVLCSEFIIDYHMKISKCCRKLYRISGGFLLMTCATFNLCTLQIHRVVTSFKFP